MKILLLTLTLSLALSACMHVAPMAPESAPEGTSYETPAVYSDIWAVNFPATLAASI